MQLHELKEQLVKKKVNPLYVFTGEEVAIMDLYIDKIVKVSGLTSKRADSVGEIFAKLQNSNSFINQSSCYIIRDDKEYLQQEKIWDLFIHGAAQGDNIIILIYTNLDKRGKFYKKHISLANAEDLPFQEDKKGCMVEFEKLIPEVLAKYIKKDTQLDITYGVELAAICNCDYSRIKLECDKLIHLASVRGCKIAEAYKIALKEKLFYIHPREVIFEFIDAVCTRDVDRVYDLLQQLKDTNESQLAMLYLLYTNLKSILLVASVEGGSGITERTGLTAWQVKLAKEKGNHYSIGELVNAMKIIRSSEKGIKTGMIEQEVAIDYILVNIL